METQLGGVQVAKLDDNTHQSSEACVADISTVLG